MKRTLPIALASFLIALPVLAADTHRPNVGLPSPNDATAGVPVTISAAVSDTESGIASCNLYVDNDDTGPMIVSGDTASVSYTFLQAGIHTMFVFCRDNENNFNSGPNASVTVTSPSGSGDGTPPDVGPVSPTTATADIPVTFSAAVSDASGVTNCQLLVNGFSKGTMTLNGGTASFSYAFDTSGTYNVAAQCADAAGNTGTGLTVSVSVSDTPPPPSNVQTGLVKLACPTGSAPDHPCTAVYYRGLDGKRHAFPNSKVYFTWYQDFSGVAEIPADEMSALPLGKQVTYRPGVKMVKFQTLNNVYAVARGGVLRWVKTEAVASALYGADWNKKIDDISDAFFLDYKFGADVNAASDYSPSGETAGATTIDQNF
ncbi:MAG TPA: Ig-like domain-containing protein [Candidatus Baltobacteraceae bacterium]|nr:Ig-like domain-containing protein [Candidatus Baltobacteraceae bacterium]